MAMVVKPKMVIKKGSSFVYDKNTFLSYTKDWSIEVKTPEELYKLIENDTMLYMDTEDKPVTSWKDTDVPIGHVRRWIGKGKSTVPVDVPFCISVGNGQIFATMYDDEPGCPKIVEFFRLLNNRELGYESVLHNAKFDLHMLANIGVHLQGKIHDTLLLAKLVNENRASYSLLDLSTDNGGIVDFEYMVDHYKKLKKIVDYSKIPRDLMTAYANADIYNCYNLFTQEYPRLAEENLTDLYENELVISYMAYNMERNGMVANIEYRDKLITELQARRDKAEAEIYELAGGIFNINSGAQLHKVMMKLGVDASEFNYTDKGNVKLDKNEMARFERKGVSIVTKILAFKQSEKLLNTYAKGIYGQIGRDNTVHCNINTGEATTGRMSVTKPALQTLPKNDTSIRSIFIPEKEYELVALDLDQVEYRIYASYAKDENLCKMIKDGHDVHSATASLLFGVPINEVTKDMRSKAKTINFGLTV